jgi:hypothetical protein
MNINAEALQAISVKDLGRRRRKRNLVSGSKETFGKAIMTARSLRANSSWKSH